MEETYIKAINQALHEEMRRDSVPSPMVWERARVRVRKKVLIFSRRTLTPTLSRLAGEGFQSALADKCSAFA